MAPIPSIEVQDVYVPEPVPNGIKNSFVSGMGVGVYVKGGIKVGVGARVGVGWVVTIGVGLGLIERENKELADEEMAENLLSIRSLHAGEHVALCAETALFN